LDENATPSALYTHLGAGVWDQGGNAVATNTVYGLVQIDTDGTLASADDLHVATALATKTYADSIAVAGGTVATEIAAGIGELATDAEAVAGTPSTGALALFVTPSNLAAVFAAAPAIGGTTPAAGTFTTLAATGAIDFDAGGSFESGGATIDIGADASADAINLGTGAAARTITIGNVTGATAVNVNVGTGNFALEGNVASTYDISGTGVNTGTITIGGGTGAQTLNMMNSTGVKTVNLATGAAANVVTIGSATGAASLDLLCGTGNFTLEGATASTYTISGTGVNTGTISIGTGTGAQTLNLMTGGTGVKTLNIGTGAIGNVITIGTVTAAASLDLLCGTGNFTLEGNVASTYDISNTGVNTGAVNIAGGTGARTITIGGGGTGAKTINMGAAASADLITIGTSTGAGSLDLACGTGNFTLEGATGTTYQISNTGVNTGQVDIAGGTGARTINIGGGGTGAKTINIGAASSADVITIGTSDGASSLDLACGTGNFTLEGATGSTYDISATGANTGTVTIGAGTGARIVNLATGGTGAKTVNIGTGAIGNIITIGTSTAAASLDLLCGTGNFTLEGATASTYEISSTGVNTGTCKFASGTGARTVEIAGGGTGIKTINIGAAATADVITIGTSTGAGSLTLAAGTGNITMTGTIEAVAAKYVVPTGIDISLNQSPVMTTNATTGGAPTGATGDVNLMYLQEGVIMEQFILGAGQTIIAPRMTATGLNIALDQANNEGAEYNFGAARTNSQHAFTIGTSAAFRMDVTLTVADVSGCEPLLIGFRKSEANNATMTSYTDYASIGLDNVAVVGNVVISTELNSGGTTNTDTTDAWADAASHKLSVLVSASGVVTYLIDDVAPTATAAFTFDSTDVVVPFIHFLNGADIAGDVELEALKIGFQ
jgi:hypothetical protein